MLVRVQQQHQQPAADSNSAPQVSRRQLLGAAGLLCAAAGMAGQPLPAVAIVQTPDGFRSQVDRYVGQTGRQRAFVRCGRSFAPTHACTGQRLATNAPCVRPAMATPLCLYGRLDGYSFVFPEQWAAVTSSGNDIFLRNPFNVEQNLFVDISSPSSSRCGHLELHSHAAAAGTQADEC